jgi:hypothetical protein
MLFMTFVKRGVLGLLVLLYVAAGAFSALTIAQERPFSLIASPLPINLSTKPGQTVTTNLRIKNNSTDTERLKVSLFKFSSNDAGEIKLDEGSAADDFLSWVSFSPKTFSADPNEWKTVKMTIKVPSTAGLGYYYAVGFSRADAATPQPDTPGAILEGQIITFVLLDVNVPGAKRELKVTEFSANRSIYEFLPAELTLKIQNTGNIHLAPSGTIFIKRGSKTVATLSANQNQGNILPNSTRTFTNEWADGFPVYVPKTADDGEAVKDKQGRPAKQLKWDFSKIPNLRFGRYTAKLVLVYDNGERDVPIEAEVSFWVVPWRLLIGFLLVAVLAGLGMWTIGRKIYGRVKRLRQK